MDSAVKHKCGFQLLSGYGEYEWRPATDWEHALGGGIIGHGYAMVVIMISMRIAGTMDFFRYIICDIRLSITRFFPEILCLLF